MQFLKTESTIGNYRLDSVAFDNNTNSFVILEYKNTKKHDVVGQCMSYHALFTSHMADFHVLYFDCNNKIPKDVKADKCSVIVIAPDYAKYQIGSVNSASWLYLFKITKYGNDIITLEEIGKNRLPRKNKSGENRYEFTCV